MDNYQIVILELAADKAFSLLMSGIPAPVIIDGGWERMFRNIEELLDLDAPMYRFPQPLPVQECDFDEVPF